MTPAGSPRMLNLGCGHRRHPEWVNADIAPRFPDVVPCDVSRGLPFPDNCFDVVYHSHMIEHIRRGDVAAFLGECRRVLRPGGIMRIATPDLERLCELYLEKLRLGAHADHEWLVIEMLDQAVRERSGGEMLEFLRKQPLPNEPFVLERIGEEGRELLAAVRATGPAPRREPLRGYARLANGVRRRAIRLREAVVRACFGDDVLEALSIGRFRLSGEVHQWLYDRVSLARLLAAAGFADARVCTAADSAIGGWTRFGLDAAPDGQALKPDSFFMEARRPA
jgi:SAM-dependent methyltransferase